MIAEIRTDDWVGAEKRKDKQARLMAKGRQISDGLLAFAAASRARLAQIDADYPDTENETGCQGDPGQPVDTTGR